MAGVERAEGGGEVNTIAHEKGKAPFHQLFESVCARTDLSQSAKLLHAAIQSLFRSDGVCFASDATLGKMIGTAGRQAKRALAELANLKLVLVLGSAKRRRIRPISVRNDQNEAFDEQEIPSEKTLTRSEKTGNDRKNGQECQGKTVKNDSITESCEHKRSEQTITDSQPATEIAVVASELCSFGVAEKEANVLATEHGPQICRRAMAEIAAKGGVIRNKAGWLCSCIRRGWTTKEEPPKPIPEAFKMPVFRLASEIPGDELAAARKARMDIANNKMMTADTAFARKWREDRGIAHLKGDCLVLESMGAAE